MPVSDTGIAPISPPDRAERLAANRARAAEKRAKIEKKRSEYNNKVRQAIMLRAAGYSYAVISTRLGWAHHAMARKAILKAREQYVREPTDELIDLELKRLDDLQSYLWPAAQRGDARAVGEILDIMQARWKLLGLEAPQKIDLHAIIEAVAAANPTLAKSEIEAEAEALVEQLGFK